MPRDPDVERAAEKLAFVFSKAQKLATRWFPETQESHTAQRITVLALMKMLVELMIAGWEGMRSLKYPNKPNDW